MGLVLDRINGPHALRDLSPAELKRLAEEARQKTHGPTHALAVPVPQGR